MNLAFFMNLRDLDASEIGESRHTRHVEWAYKPSLFINIKTGTRDHTIKSNLTQLITKYTHYKPKCKPSLIDLILTKNPELITNITHNPPIGKSHHEIITAKLRLNCSNISSNKKNKDKIIKPNFEKADFQALNEFLNEINWNTELQDKNVNEMWEFLKNKIKTAQEMFVPNKVINNNKMKSNHITMDNDLHSLLKNKRYFFKLYKKYKTKTTFYNL